MGKNKSFSATKNLPMSMNGKFTNHSVRKTCIKTLLDSGVAHNNVAQLSGHKSLKSLDSYAVASHGHPMNSSGETPPPRYRVVIQKVFLIVSQ